MVNLKSINYKEQILKLCANFKDFEQTINELGVQTCQMSKVPKCQKCQTFYSLFKDSFFESFDKRLFELLQMIKCWSVELTIAKTVSFLKMQDIPACRQTVAKVFKM
jgi:hypothetical protein